MFALLLGREGNDADKAGNQKRNHVAIGDDPASAVTAVAAVPLAMTAMMFLAAVPPLVAVVAVAVGRFVGSAGAVRFVIGMWLIRHGPTQETGSARTSAGCEPRLHEDLLSARAHQAAALVSPRALGARKAFSLVSSARGASPSTRAINP